MPEPRHHKGESKQDYCTPPEFIAAVCHYLKIDSFGVDLAASEDNTICRDFLSEDDNSLGQPWSEITGGPYGEWGWGWCNPPFARIEPWVRHANEQMQLHAQVAMLLPAGVGSNWFKQWVHNQAKVLFLNGRLTFVGQPTCYPKDCILILWDEGIAPGYDVWSWGQEP